MLTTRLRRRILSAFALSVLGVAGSTIVLAEPAQAASNVLHPSGCDQVTNNSWSGSCWVGYSYVRKSVSVLAVQYVLKDTGHSPGTPDCYFGTNTDNATIAYQKSYGLTKDGIVGGSTWGSMQGWTVNSGISDAYGTYWNLLSDGLRFYWQSALGGNWFVLDPYYSTGNRYVAVAGYVSQNVTGFCP